MWDLKIIDTDKTLYIAIADAIERDIKLGILKPGEKLPTHRGLAKTVGVNVTTITRAFNEAEKRGLVSSIVGSGTFVSTDSGYYPSLIDNEKDSDKLLELGLILPLYSKEPDISPVVEKVLRKNNMNELMAYTPPQGLEQHRLVGSEWMKHFGVTADPENVIITAGTQHALNCIFSSAFQPGDRIASDALIYPGVKTAARRCGIQLEAVEMDDEGMLPQALDAACRRHAIKGVYTVATMQNPTTSAMSAKRRAEIAEIIEKNDLILVEDDIYRFLSSEKETTLSQLLPERSVYIAGISKAFYAGLRTSFVSAPKRLCNRISQAVFDTQWMTSSFNAEIACECITSGLADKIIAAKLEEIELRASVMKSKLSGFNYKYTQNCMFAWLKLTEDWSSGDFEKTAYENGVNVIPSEKFAIGGVVPPNYVRISLSGADSVAELERGLDVLTQMLNYEISPKLCVL